MLDQAALPRAAGVTGSRILLGRACTVGAPVQASKSDFMAYLCASSIALEASTVR
jgi:hypothetical protein